MIKQKVKIFELNKVDQYSNIFSDKIKLPKKLPLTLNFQEDNPIPGSASNFSIEDNFIVADIDIRDMRLSEDEIVDVCPAVEPISASFNEETQTTTIHEAELKMVSICSTPHEHEGLRGNLLSAEERPKQAKNIKKGKRNKSAGSAFEKKTREDLEKKGWIVSKFQSTVEFATKKEVFEISHISSLDARLIHAKNKFLGPGKPVMLGAGFPDFIAFRRKNLGGSMYDFCYDVIGVEAKSNGKLSRIEKKKCKFLLEKRIFNRILIASKKKVGRKVVVEYNELKMQDLN